MNHRLSRQIRTVLWKEAAEVTNKPLILAGLAMLGAMWMFNIGVIAVRLRQGAAGPSVVEALIDSVVTHQALSMSMIALFLFFSTTFHRERFSGTLEAAVASGLSVHALWVGKCLFVFALGLAFAMLTAAGVVAEMNWLIVEGPGVRLPTAPAVVFFLLFVPALALGQCLVFGAIQLLSGNAVLAGVVYLLVATSYLGASAAWSDDLRVGWLSLGPYAGVAVVLFGFTGYLSTRLDRERVIYATG